MAECNRITGVMSRTRQRMRKFLGYLALLLSVIALGTGAVILYTPLGQRPLGVLFPVGDTPPVVFGELQLGDRRNQYLVCPPDYCGTVPHAVSPVFDMPAARLRERWRAFVAGQARVSQRAEYENGAQIDYVQRSARFRFPDIITVRFIPVPPSQSTLAIYSRSIYGRDDLGVNRARVESWLRHLQQDR